MTLEEKRAYTETLIILEDLNLSSSIPKELLETMKNNQDFNWNFTFDSNIPLENQRILRKTMILLSTIYIAYICDDEEEKKKLKDIYDENEKKLIEASDISNVIKNNNIDRNKEENVNNVELPTVVRKSLFDKILSGLKKFFGGR